MVTQAVEPSLFAKAAERLAGIVSDVFDNESQQREWWAVAATSGTPWSGGRFAPTLLGANRNLAILLLKEHWPRGGESSDTAREGTQRRGLKGVFEPCRSTGSGASQSSSGTAVLGTDRADTVRTTRGSATAAAMSLFARAHQGTPPFAAAGGDDQVQFKKTLAHATRGDTQSGQTTQWQNRGKELADRLAKQGAAAHGRTKTHLEEAAAVSSLAYLAQRWAGEARVFVQEAVQDGARQAKRPRCRRLGLLLETQGPKRLKAETGAAAGPDRARQSAAAETTADLDELGGHNVAVAAVAAACGAALGPFAFRQAGGAYFWHRVGSLSSPCRGAKPYSQRALLSQGRFPSDSERYQGRSIEEVGPGRPSQFQQLRQQLSASGGKADPCGPQRRRFHSKTGPTASEMMAETCRRNRLGRYGPPEQPVRRHFWRNSARFSALAAWRH